MSFILQEDAERASASSAINWRELDGKSVLITGGTGFIGSALLRALRSASARHGLELDLLATGRDQIAGERLARDCGARFMRHDIREAFAVPGPVDYIFHCAAMTRSPDMVRFPADVAESSLKGVMNALALAREKKVKSMVCLSSMEVYGQNDPARPWLSEDAASILDPLDPRSCYPSSKQASENLCVCHAVQYGTPVKIARLAQTLGPGLSINDSRVVAQFASAAVRGRDIELHTPGRTLRNYCSIADAVQGLLLLLIKGEKGQAYNIAHPKSGVSIRELAEIAARALGRGRVSVLVSVPADLAGRGYAAETQKLLNPEKMLRLGWRPADGLEESFARMAAHWRESGQLEKETPAGELS